MYAPAIRIPPRHRHWSGRRIQSSASEQCAKGCAFSDVGLDCIKYLKLGDPCCGSGGMFIQSADFVKARQGDITGINVYGQEKEAAT